jgi:hypothetical protein
MDLIFTVAIGVVIIGGLCWLLGLAPINETVKKVGTGIIVIIGIIWAIKIIAGMAH